MLKDQKIWRMSHTWRRNHLHVLRKATALHDTEHTRHHHQPTKANGNHDKNRRAKKCKKRREQFFEMLSTTMSFSQLNERISSHYMCTHNYATFYIVSGFWISHSTRNAMDNFTSYMPQFVNVYAQVLHVSFQFSAPAKCVCLVNNQRPLQQHNAKQHQTKHQHGK